LDTSIAFDPDLIRRYDRSGPRYTSYPTAVQFHEGFSEAQYRDVARRSNATGQPLSLYVHIPFCDTVCFYCGCNKVITKNRHRSSEYLDKLYREIEFQGALFDRARKVEQLHWGGGTPTFISHEQMRELMSKTREHFTLHEDDTGEYSIEVDPREANSDTIALLRELGFNRLSVGVQDFDPAVQKAVNRIQPREVTLDVLEAARHEGFRSTNIDLIYGLPLQSVESFQRTLNQVVELAPDRLSVFNYAHLPQMFKVQRQIRDQDLPSPAVKLAILEMLIEHLTDAGYVYIGMDHFARPDDELAVAQQQGTLYRNFQGYSTHSHCDLVALGATSIGMVDNTFSQNLRDVNEYASRVDAGHIPVFRGIELNDDDRLRRHVIGELICNFRLRTYDVEARFEIDFEDYFATELAELALMERDGLVRRDSEQIQVLPAGRLLIRNVCMVFDHYLRQAAGQRFSKVI
jgi:oxygen-independent coproporphyrinogen-3 oxidase